VTRANPAEPAAAIRMNWRRSMIISLPDSACKTVRGVCVCLAHTTSVGARRESRPAAVRAAGQLRARGDGTRLPGRSGFWCGRSRTSARFDIPAVDSAPGGRGTGVGSVC
jgi:hypothetical protein